MIYFMTAREIGRVKIGYAKNPKQRLAVLQTGCPTKIAIEATCEGGLKFESELHRMFQSLRRQGEWFELAPVLEMVIHFFRSGDDIPDNVDAYLAPFMLAHLRSKLKQAA